MGVTWWNLQSKLLVAIQSDDEIKVKQLLAAGVDCDVRFYSGSIRSPALCLCVERDSFNLVRLLLDSGCSVNQSDTRGQTALHLAAGRGDAEMIRLLLSKKASAKSLDERKRTPLHWAALRTSPDIARVLLRDETDVDPLDHDGYTPLLLACANGCSATALLLLLHGADPKAVDNLGNTALHVAVDCGDGLIGALISAGADVNAVNAAGLTPLHVVVRCGSLRGRPALIQQLASAGANLDQQTPLGQTALQTAIQERDETSALLLLRLQALPDTQDRLGLSPLFHAARDGNQLLVQSLLTAGCWMRRQRWMQEPQLVAEISHPKILQLIATVNRSCPPLIWLARRSFRSHNRQHSRSAAEAGHLPATLLHYIDFGDARDPWI